MPLTPEDVSNKRFTPVRLREGYDMGEVDEFLDEVEAELTRLLRENNQLRGGAPVPAEVDGVPSTADGSATTTADGNAATSAGGTGSTATAPAASSTAPTDGSAPDPATAPAQQASGPAPGAPVETITVSTAAEASSAAVRLLEIATRNADELVGEARTEAERILDEARTGSERREAESKATADRLEADARTRAQALEAETQERRQQLFGDLETEKQRLDGEVENLRSFEREYRSRLKTYFEQQLAALDGTGDSGRTSDDGQSPRRLSSLLGKDSDEG